MGTTIVSAGEAKPRRTFEIPTGAEASVLPAMVPAQTASAKAEGGDFRRAVRLVYVGLIAAR
ncbi:MAG TPA: hypothetical protein VEA41_20325 [Salinarimonas sp.]|nr:hypothetical protein [Salinarimonas sp.]